MKWKGSICMAMITHFPPIQTYSRFQFGTVLLIMFKSSPHTCEVSWQKEMLKISIVKWRDIQNLILEAPSQEFFEKHAILKHLLRCLAHIELLRLLYRWQQLFCPFWYKIQSFIICSFICKEFCFQYFFYIIYSRL